MSLNAIAGNPYVGLPVKEGPNNLYPNVSDSTKRVINSSEKIKNYALTFFKCLSFVSGLGLGLLTGASVTIGLASPIGLGITGGIILVGLTGTLVCGGKKELLKALMFTVSSFCIGFWFGGIGGALNAEQAAIMAGKKAGLINFALRQSVNAATAKIMWVIPAAYCSLSLSFVSAFCGVSIQTTKSKK